MKIILDIFFMALIISNHQKLLPTLKYELSSFIRLYPELFFPIVNFKSSKKQAVNQSTEIVIEGFPRSGNSFFVGAFELAQNHSVKIAHHLHAPAQLIMAARKNIPAILLIRNPIDAVMSMKAMDLELSYIRPPINQKLTSLMKSYIDFYKTLIPYSDHYIISLFEVTTNDFSSVIDKVNNKFQTNFQAFNFNKKNTQEIFNKRGVHAGPNAKRQEIKQLLHNEFQSDAMQKLSAEAESIYHQFELIAQKQ
ncbi:hypothetical protein STA3757_12740 [Stanieria sp. NIES-3757]|nr:hypothetical protein STA3757_12740 [Stanieria sp. NIES-3757]